MNIKNFLAAIIVAASTSASANSFTTDVTDLWWNQNENGWGVNIIAQADTLFVTFFVYGTNNTPTWYVASSATFSPGANNSQIYSGPLYQTSGPYFGAGAFNPSAVGVRQVGTVTLTFTGISNATMTYVADGVNVSKSLTRQTWRNNTVSGSFIGALIGTYSGACPGGTGYAEELGTLATSQSGSNVTIQVSYQTGVVCTYSGSYNQSGRMGAITSGTLACSNGVAGTFSAGEIEITPQGLTGRATATAGACSWSGRFGGLRRG